MLGAVKVIMIVFVFLIICQWSCQIRYLIKAMNKFQNKNVQQRLDAIYHIESYRFIKFSQERLSGRYQGQLIMGPDRRSSIDQYLIMYYLYPVVDVRSNKDLQKCLIVYNKKDPLSIVPDDYDILGIYNSRSLLAVQKE